MNTGLSPCAICWPRLCKCPRAIAKAMDRFAVRGFYLHSVAMTGCFGRMVVIDEHGVHKFEKRTPRWWRWRNAQLLPKEKSA